MGNKIIVAIVAIVCLLVAVQLLSKKSNKVKDAEGNSKNEKYPLSAVCSFFIPGLGQFIKGNITESIIYFSLSVANCWILFHNKEILLPFDIPAILVWASFSLFLQILSCVDAYNKKSNF
jgi:hypothetical protein